jgi:hypothetical protein
MSRKFFTDIDMQSASKVVGLPTPTNPGDAVPKSYVDSAVEGLAWKDSCRVSTQANLSIASPGATIDGVTMASQDRVLVRSQTTGAENGIYVWNGAAVTMTRALDASTFDELEQAVVSVEEGSSVGSTFRQTAVNGTLGTTTVTWAAFGTSAPSATESTAGIAAEATQTETNSGLINGKFVTPAKLASWSGRLKKYTTDIGDGSALSFAISHGLNSRDVIVRVFPNSGQYDDVEVDVQRTSTTQVTLVFVAAPSAPALNAYRVVVIG